MLQLEKNLYEIQHHIEECSNLVHPIIDPLYGYSSLTSGSNDGTQYLDTNIRATNEICVEIKFEWLSTITDNDSDALIGYRSIDVDENPLNTYYLGFKNGITAIYGNEMVSGIDGIDLRTPGIKILKLDKNELYFQNGEYGEMLLVHTFSDQVFETSDNLYLFCENLMGEAINNCHINLYYCRIYMPMSNGYYDRVKDYCPIRKWNKEKLEYEYFIYDCANKEFRLDTTLNSGNSPWTIVRNVKYEPIETSQYSFKRISEDWWESTNQGVTSSYSIIKVTFDVIKSGTNIPIKYISYGESNFDYGIFSTLDHTLTSSNTADTSNVKLNAKGQSSASEKDFVYANVDAGTHFIYVKFIKDGSGDTGNDSLRFRLVEEDVDNFYQQPAVQNISVTKPTGTYQFVLQSDGYYKSNNNGVNNSYALAKISFTILYGTPTLTLSYRCYAESGYDIGLFSNLDTTLSASNSIDSSYKLKCANSSSYATLTYTNLPLGTHFIYAKYRKDVSSSNNDDALRFKIISIE